MSFFSFHRYKLIVSRYFVKIYLRAEYGVMLKCEVIVAYSGGFVLTAGTSALVGRWERWISAQFSGSAFIIIERPRPRRSHRYSATAEVVDSAETATERTTARVGLHQAMGRREKICATVLSEKIGFEGGTPEGGRRCLIRCCYLICNWYMTFE